jgi:trk system potassium uptake protein TrkA
LIDRVENGSVTDKTLIENLEIGRCEHFVSLTNDQEDNIRSCEIVKDLDESTHTVARRTEKHNAIPSDNDAIDDVVYPEEHGARATVNFTMNRDFRTLESIEGDIELIEVRVWPNSPVAEMRLSDVMFPEGTQVVSDNKNNDIATGETVLEPNETYLVASKTNMTDDIRKLFGED